MDVLSAPPPPLRVLILDGQFSHALAAVRSLGRRGAHVTVASHKPHAMSFSSRYCDQAIESPASNADPSAYAGWLLELLRRQRYDALLFFGEATADIVSLHRDTIQRHTGCPYPSRELFLTADRKDRVTRLARQVGVPTPGTHDLEKFEDVEKIAGQLRFPVIVKGVYGSGGHQVGMARDLGSLRREVRRIAALRESSSLPLPIVQEYIPGRGYGLSALMRRGEPVAVFMHRRLAEHDVSRGVRLAHAASAAESVDEPELRASALTLLQALCWDGMAMVEFRRDSRDGRFRLMEINPRFVGTLDLAIAAGVDFPWLYALLAAGRPVAGPNRYRLALKYRWLISKSVANAVEHPLGYTLGALSSLRLDTRTDICWRDLGPLASQLREAGWWMREHLRRPHHPTSSAPVSASEPLAPHSAEASEELLSGSR